MVTDETRNWYGEWDPATKGALHPWGMASQQNKVKMKKPTEDTHEYLEKERVDGQISWARSRGAPYTMEENLDFIPIRAFGKR